MAFTLNQGAVWPPLPTLEDKIAEAIKKVDKVTETNILAGFDYEVDGTKYHFSYDVLDQCNFSQMISDAILSKQLGSTPMDELKATYGVTEEGDLDRSKLPVKLPDEWSQIWQGHLIGEDGSDTSVSLTFTVDEFLALAYAGGMHNKTQLGLGWVKKAQIRAATDQDNLKEILETLGVEEAYQQVLRG